MPLAVVAPRVDKATVPIGYRNTATSRNHGPLIRATTLRD